MRFSLDYPLALGYLLSALVSLLMLGSISPERLLQQGLILALGAVLLLYLSSQESAVYRSFAPLAYLLALILLLTTVVFTTLTRGTTSWLDLGFFRFQPSEFAKPLLILSFAFFLERFPPTSFRNFLFNAALYALPTLLIFLQPDLGTALVVTAIWLLQLFVAGLPWGYILSLILGFLALLPALPYFLRDYQLARLTTFLDPFSDPLGSGYNVIQSMIAVGSGGLLGKGLGHGTQSHLRFLPERHTDFAFASLAEELGLFGSLIILSLVGLFIFRLLHALTHAESKSSRYLFAGALAYFAFQSLLNIGMNSGVAPVTGITLPLISYGGSSILATAIILGLSSSVIASHGRERLLEIR